MSYSIEQGEGEWMIVMGQRLRRLRNERNLTMDKVAAWLDPPMTKSAMSHIELGDSRLTVYRALQLADLYGLTLDELLGYGD